MTTANATPNYYGTLAANVADVITMSQEWRTIEITNITGAYRIDFTHDGSAPVVGGSSAGFMIPALVAAYDLTGVPGVLVITLISAGVTGYSIIGSN